VGFELGTFIIIVLSAAAIVWLLNPFEGHKPRTKRAKGRLHRFHAISIKFEDSACERAKAFSSRRFLAEDSPRIPLPQCRPEDCHCTYVHHEDRRSGVADRRSASNLQSEGGEWGERGSQGRRKSDWRVAVLPG